MKSTVLRWIRDIMVIIIGSAVYSLGVHIFISPNSIAPGGVTGIAVIIAEFAPIKVGTLILLLNVPLIIAGFIKLNKSTMVKTLIAVALISVFTDLAEMFVPVYKAGAGDGILAAVFGGGIMGFGMGMNYRSEGTTGGTDILTKILGNRFPEMKLGVLQAVIDGIVVLGGLAAYRDINVVLYAIIAIFVQTKAMDFVVYGGNDCRFLFVFSDNTDEIAKRLLEQRRGVTLFKAEGAYSGSERKVIATAVHRNAYSKVKRLVHEVDPGAFVVVTGTSEVLGEGFTKV